MMNRAMPQSWHTRTRLLVLRVIGWMVARRTRAGGVPDTPRLLVMRPDHLGDALFLGPTLRHIRRSLPAAHVTVMVGQWALPVLDGLAGWDDVLICPFPAFTRHPSSFWQPYYLLLVYARLLRRGSYDAALLARDDHWWGALLVALAGIPIRVGARLPEMMPFLTHPVSIPLTVHRSALSLTLAARLCAVCGHPQPSPPTAQRLVFTPTQADWQAADRLLALAGWTRALPYVVIQPGAGALLKVWDAMSWARVAAALARELHVGIVLTGSPAEAVLTSAIITHLRQEQPDIPILDATGQTAWGVLAAVLARSALCLGVDSGGLHLATAVGTPSIALFGPVDPRRYGPVGDQTRHLVLTSGLPCQPCGRLDYCRLQNSLSGPPVPCLQAISPARVIRSAIALYHLWC